MGSDDSVYPNKRTLPDLPRSVAAARTIPAMGTNLITKFLVLVTTVTLLIYVLADHVPTSRPALSSIQIARDERTPVSVPLSAPAPTVKKHARVDEKEERDLEITDHKREAVERNVDNICKHNIVRKGGKILMHDILKYVSVMEKPITYLDIGANMGSTSVPVIVCFKPEHRVIAVEPIKLNFEAIINSIKGASLRPIPAERFLAANIGFSDETKKTKMFIPGRRGDNAALSEKASTVVFKDGLRQEEVEVYRGDEFLKIHKAEPKLIKIDVQGSEIRVLRGMEEYLKKHKKVLIMAEQDYRLIENSGFEVYDVYDFMKQLGYKVYLEPKVESNDGEFRVNVNSEEISREQVRMMKGDLVFWKE